MIEFLIISSLHLLPLFINLSFIFFHHKVQGEKGIRKKDTQSCVSDTSVIWMQQMLKFDPFIHEILLQITWKPSQGQPLTTITLSFQTLGNIFIGQSSFLLSSSHLVSRELTFAVIKQVQFTLNITYPRGQNLQPQPLSFRLCNVDQMPIPVFLTPTAQCQNPQMDHLMALSHNLK